jgi:hypothetical protein
MHNHINQIKGTVTPDIFDPVYCHGLIDQDQERSHRFFKTPTGELWCCYSYMAEYNKQVIKIYEEISANLRSNSLIFY